MFNEDRDWLPRQERLKKLIMKPDSFDEAMQLALELHALLHVSEVSHSPTPTLGDALWDGLTEADYLATVRTKKATIAWDIWHVTRIEDLIANIAINNSKQVLDDPWLTKLGITVHDTANAWTGKEIQDFSRAVDKAELKNYRTAVGRQTRDVLRSLTNADMKRKPEPESIERIVSEGGLVAHKDSIWLKEFWAGKTIAGLVLLPITRHQMMHLPHCLEIKQTMKAL